MRRRRITALLLLTVLPVAACNNAGTITGLVAGGAAGGATANPAIGYAVAVGTAAAADEAFKYYGRLTQNAEQNAIATAGGGLAPGMAAPWRIEHTIPIGDEHGEVRLVRDIPNPLAPCREIAFSVVGGKHGQPRWYTTTICRQPERWKWALAEPATARWGYLQ